jgi:hypothetical protein
MRSILSILLLLLIMQVMGQVRVDRPLVLTGTETDQRQLHGLEPTTVPGRLLSAEAEAGGMHRYATPGAAATWEVDLPGLDQMPQPGTHVLVKAPAGADGEVWIAFNGHGPYPVLDGGMPLQSQDTGQDMVLSLVFDGSSFQLMNTTGHRVRPCPEGTVAVNEQFCIEPEQGPALTFWDAIHGCNSKGMRLCSWGEYHAACVNGETLGITGMGTQWEWTNSATNENGSVRMVRGCYSGANNWPDSTLWHRCCFTR